PSRTTSSLVLQISDIDITEIQPTQTEIPTSEETALDLVSPEQIENLSVKKLRALLKKNLLKVRGNKQELRERLKAHLFKENRNNLIVQSNQIPESIILTPKKIQAMNVRELRELLKSVNCSIGGLKSQLVERAINLFCPEEEEK